MKCLLSCVAAVLLWAVPASAATRARLNVRLDVSNAQVAPLGLEYDVFWLGSELEMEVDWDAKKLFLVNGFALGARKEGQYYTDGTYITFRTFSRVPLSGGRWLGLYPSAGVVYGMSGPPVMRVARDGTWIFPVRTIDIPGTEVKGDGIIYPEFSVALRLKLWRFTAEPVVGVRSIMFGTERGDRYSAGRVLVPTAGIRVGFELASVK